MNRSTPGLPVHHQLPESTQTHVHWVGDAIQPPHPLSSPSPPALNLSQHQGLFQWVSSLHQVAKVLEFQLQHQSFQWTPRTDLLFRMDWLDLLAVQGTLKSLLQHHSSKASILWNSAFFIVQLSHPYMTTGKTIALTRRTFVDEVMSLLFNMLSRLRMLQFNSILKLSTWRQHPIPQMVGSVLPDDPTSDTNHKSRLSPVFLIKLLKMTDSYHSFLSVHHLLEQFRELIKISYLLDYWFVIKGYNSGTVRERCIEWGVCGRTMCFHTFSQHHQPRSSLNPTI